MGSRRRPASSSLTWPPLQSYWRRRRFRNICSRNFKEVVEMNSWRVLPAVYLLCLASSVAVAFGQSNPTYIQFSPAEVKGALYKPDSGPAPHVGILVTHRTSNVMGSLTCTELAKRGFVVLCLNPRSDNNEALVRWESIALDVRSGVDFPEKTTGHRESFASGRERRRADYELLSGGGGAAVLRTAKVPTNLFNVAASLPISRAPTESSSEMRIQEIR